LLLPGLIWAKYNEGIRCFGELARYNEAIRCYAKIRQLYETAHLEKDTKGIVVDMPDKYMPDIYYF